MATNDPDGTVIGLNDIPKDEWPPLYVHYLFDAMVGIGFYLLAVSACFVVLLAVKRCNAYNRWLLTAMVAGGPLAFLAIELGWFYAEVGRQPWIIRGYLRVSDAATANAHVSVTFWMFAVLYAVLGIVSLFVLARLFHNKPAELELEAQRIIL